MYDTHLRISHVPPKKSQKIVLSSIMCLSLTVALRVSLIYSPRKNSQATLYGVTSAPTSPPLPHLLHPFTWYGFIVVCPVSLTRVTWLLARHMNPQLDMTPRHTTNVIRTRDVIHCQHTHTYMYTLIYTHTYTHQHTHTNWYTVTQRYLTSACPRRPVKTNLKGISPAMRRGVPQWALRNSSVDLAPT